MIPGSGNHAMMTNGGLPSLYSCAGDLDEDCITAGINVIRGRAGGNNEGRVMIHPELNQHMHKYRASTESYGSGTFHLS